MNLDDQLRSAADDVRAEVASLTPPPFTPPSPTGARLALVIIAISSLGLGWWAIRTDDTSGPVVDAVSDTTLVIPDVQDDLASTPPLERTDGVGGFEPLPSSSMEQPSVGAYTIEPDTGVAIRRLTSASPGSVQQPVFSRTQAHNADGSAVLLYRTRDAESDPGHIVVDSSTGEIVATPDLSAATDIENISWHHADPDLVLFAAGADVMSVDVRTGAVRVAVSTACLSLTHGDTAGSTTSSTPAMGLLCEQTDGTTVWAAADMQNGSLLIGPEATISAAPVPSISGDRFVVVGDTEIVVLDRSLELERTIQIEASAFTVASDSDGTDVLVATVFGGPTEPGTIVVVDLTTGVTQVVVGPETGAPYPPSGTQLSTAALGASNRIAVTTFTVDGGALANEVMLLELGGADSVMRRLAHHRAEDNRSDDWPSTPTVAISPDGTSVVFSSNWGGGEIDTYEVALPR